MYKRKCPKCDEDINHINKYSRNNAQKVGRLCRSCATKDRNEKYGVNQKFIDQYASDGCCKGKDNPFYGMKHSDDTKSKLSKADKGYTKTKKFKKTMSKATSGLKNPMHGITFYDIWVKKYGKDEADRKLRLLKAKHSENSRGSKNSMFGKPSPSGSGNGWKGWYKGWFFRSIRELSFMIKEIEAKGLKWRSAETKDLSIPYIDYKGDSRTYRADFLVEEKTLVEVKPVKLKNSLSVKLKQKAAMKFCKKRGYIYFITDVAPLTDGEIRKLYDKKVIKFMPSYEKKYLDRINN